MSKPKLAIVLLSYNSLELVVKYLPLIKDSIPAEKDYQVIVVDNASSDAIGEYVKSEHSDVRLITLKENHGFTNGYVESLAQIDAKYYCLISSDIEVTAGFTEPAIDLLESDETIAACQPKIMSWDRRKEFEYAGAAGGYIDHLGYPFCRGRMVNVVEEDHGQYDTVQEIFWASGACLFIRADLYHEAGGLDNDFFAHMEEIDLCWRLKNMGYKIIFQPKSVVYHMGGFIIKYGSPMKVFRNHRNNLIMMLKNLPPYEGLWKIPLRFCMDLLTLLKMAADGNWNTVPAISKAHFQFVWYFPKWYSKRIEVNKLKNNPNLRGIFPKSMVWQFFAKKNKLFSQLNWKP